MVSFDIKTSLSEICLKDKSEKSNTDHSIHILKVFFSVNHIGVRASSSYRLIVKGAEPVLTI
jgi:hypothetical protein